MQLDCLLKWILCISALVFVVEGGSKNRRRKSATATAGEEIKPEQPLAIAPEDISDFFFQGKGNIPRWKPEYEPIVLEGLKNRHRQIGVAVFSRIWRSFETHPKKYELLLLLALQKLLHPLRNVLVEVAETLETRGSSPALEEAFNTVQARYFLNFPIRNQNPKVEELFAKLPSSAFIQAIKSEQKKVNDKQFMFLIDGYPDELDFRLKIFKEHLDSPTAKLATGKFDRYLDLRAQEIKEGYSLGIRTVAEAFKKENSPKTPKLETANPPGTPKTPNIPSTPKTPQIANSVPKFIEDYFTNGIGTRPSLDSKANLLSIIRSRNSLRQNQFVRIMDYFPADSQVRGLAIEKLRDPTIPSIRRVKDSDPPHARALIAVRFFLNNEGLVTNPEWKKVLGWMDAKAFREVLSYPNFHLTHDSQLFLVLELFPQDKELIRMAFQRLDNSVKFSLRDLPEEQRSLYVYLIRRRALLAGDSNSASSSGMLSRMMRLFDTWEEAGRLKDAFTFIREIMSVPHAPRILGR